MSSAKIKVSNLETSSNLSIQGSVTIDDEVISNADFKKTFEGNKSSGRQEFITPGNFNWTVPEGVVKISVLAVGSGGAGWHDWASSGGCGGGLAYADNIEVTAGDTISITVGGDRTKSQGGGTGPATSIGSFLSATAGRDSAGNSAANDSHRGTFVSGSVVAKGGRGGLNSSTTAGGGGGAAGYSGDGGNGYYGASGTQPYNGSGGGGAGGSGYDSSTYGFTGGGGVGINGEGPSGMWGTVSGQGSQPSNNGNSFYSDLRYSGAGGSGGEHGGPYNNSSATYLGRTRYHGDGGRYGGAGGGGGTSVTNNNNFCKGARGAAVIAWSTDNNFSIAN